jgi:hypothetical protein
VNRFLRLVPALTALVFANHAAGANSSRQSFAAHALTKDYNPSVEVRVQSKNSASDLCGVALTSVVGVDPLHGRRRPVLVDDYFPTIQTNEKSLRTVILLPPTGGENVLDQKYALALCDAGFRIVLVKSWEGDTDVELGMGMHDRGAIRVVTAVRHVVEWLQPLPPEKLGIMGTSVGGISASLILGFEPRISAGYLIVAGGGMSHIIAHSGESTLARLREMRMKEYGFAHVEDYEAALRQNVRIDPLDFVGYSGPKKVAMVIAEEDGTVATSAQDALWEAYSRPQVLRYRADHFWAIVRSALFQRQRVIDFFAENLSEN